MNRAKRATGIPSKVDWREAGAVGPIQSQQICGACWAFSTIGMAESMYAIKNGTLYPFSVQEVGRYIPDTLVLQEVMQLLKEGRVSRNVNCIIICFVFALEFALLSSKSFTFPRYHY